MFSIEVSHYRALSSARCAFPPGLTVVLARNGAGKTTLLDVVPLLRHIATRGLREALAHHGGLAAKTWGAAREEDVRLEIRHGRLRWELVFANDGESVADLRERLWIDDDAEPYATQGIGESSVRVGGDLFGLVGGGPAGWPSARMKRTDLEPDFEALAEARLYSDFDVHRLRTTGSTAVTGGADRHLHTDGRNAFHVLRNWRDRPATRRRYELVVEALRLAFPGFRDLAFHGDTSVVFGGFVFDRDLDREEPALTAANGLLVALLHATAVASAPRGGYVALDEIENGLHPFAIHALLEVFEAHTRAEDISLVVATHSPVVLDHLQASPERVLVLASEDPRRFVPLTEMRDREYLNDFSLGNMYMGEQIAPQRP